MRRSICITEPSVAYAGEVRRWRFSFTSAHALPPKTILRFDPLSRGKLDDWQLPEVGAKAKSNAITLHLPNEKAVAAKAVETPDGRFQYEFVLPTTVNPGEKLIFQLGGSDGNKAQNFIQRRRPFYLYIDPKGKGDFKEPEVFSLDVRGNHLENIRIITPSLVFKNSRFDVVIRFEDSFGNLTGNAPEGTLIELSYDQLRENLNWKLFVPETGFLTLPNLYFNEPGVYRLRLKNLQTNEVFISPPIMCYLEEQDQLFWGLLHGDTDRIHSNEDIEGTLRYFRDNSALQFFSSSSEEAEERTTNDQWKLIGNQVAEFNEEERFVTLLGFQWSGEAQEEGVRHFIYMKDNKPILRKKDTKSNTLKKIYKSHVPKELLSIPCLTMGKGFSYNFKEFQPEFERVVEIYNAWGSSECLAKEGNPRPIKAASKKGIGEVDEGSIRNALTKGCRFGFVAGGMDKRGIYSDFATNNQAEYSPGLTAVLASEYSRELIFQALYNRSCYATTGAKIVLSFNIAGKPMGSEINTKTKPGLAYNRHIHGFVAGTAEITEVTIYRNGETYKTFTPKKNFFEFTIDDDSPIEKVLLPAPENQPPFTYYYLRALQSDGHIAWASPIWIDSTQEDKKKQPKKK